MSYGFIYRNFDERTWLFYNGDPSTLSRTYNAEEAVAWYARVQSLMVDTVIIRPPKKKVKIKFPKKRGETDPGIFDWIKDTRLEPRMNYLLNKFLDSFDLTVEGTFQARVANRKIDSVDKRKLMVMRDMIEGMFRISPVQVQTWVDDQKRPVYEDWDFSEDLMSVNYHVGTKSHKTNMIGVYTPNFRDTFFKETKEHYGFALQDWQQDFRLNRWRITLVIGSRDIGKSLCSTDFTAEYLFRELISPKERAKDFEIHYYGLTKDNNNTVAKYIQRMAMSLIDHKVITWSKTKQTLTLKDWESERVVIFMSGAAEEAGRWQKPNMVVIDEWGFYKDDKVWKITLWHTNIPVIVISTVDSTTPRQWFWDSWQEYYKFMRQYEPIDQLIHRIWKKYGFDKVKTRADMQKMIDKGICDKARTELYQARPFVALKYTIDDANPEVLPPEVKENKIRTAMMQSEEYMLAEYYGELYDMTTVFNYDGLIDVEIPDRFDDVLIGYDEAEDYDWAALVTIGIASHKAYVIKSEVLKFTDIFERYSYIKWQLAAAITLTGHARNVHFIADCTRANSIYREIEKEVWEIDCPVKYTKGTDAHQRERPFHRVGKAYMVNITKDYFINTNNIVFSQALEWEKGLFEEMSNFVRIKGNVYWAKSKKYKDDQVNAMMICLYYAHEKWFKDNLSTIRNFYGRNLDDIQAEYNNQQYKAKQEKIEDALDLKIATYLRP